LRHLLTEQQQARRAEFRDFVASHVEPAAAGWERDQAFSSQVVSMMAEKGYLGLNLPEEFGGQGSDVVTFGLLNEAFGRASSSLTSVFTVQAMVAMAILKWGTRQQKSTWLPRLASGQTMAAFAMTEPDTGSDLTALRTQFTKRSGSSELLLNGAKRWITCAQIADVFLVFGKMDNQSVACLVPRESPGLAVEPIRELMGFRAAGLARVTFANVEVPIDNIVGKPGFGLSHVMPVGMQYGRISTACSALGIMRGCFEESVSYAAERKIGDRPLGEIGMMRTLIAGMGTDLEAGNFLCHHACRSEDERSPEAFENALTAKYFTSRGAVRASSDAVQLRGAAGVHESSPTARFYGSAKIMEIIEGTTQVHEDLLGKMYLGQRAALGR
jgi:alkylation response protein AidB-like acyl-CoA dehydrogenase